MNSTFITVAVIGTLAVISPGPDFLIVTRNSLLYSKRVGFATALGIAVGNVGWIAMSVLGISVVIARTVLLFNALKLLGAVYLIYLGARLLCGGREPVMERILPQGASEEKKHLSPPKAFRMGLFTNILNPKCAMFYVSFFSMVITRSTPTVEQCAYGLEVMLIAICWFSLLATVLSVEKIRGPFRHFSVWLNRVTGTILIVLGVKVALYHQ
ncbi:MAG: LysE family transporter [Verrucomicrobiota bacterium]|jgi:RhtB (resistance to homoserine/threonine) family protein